MALKSFGDPYGTRTRVYGVRGRCPRPLDEGVAKDRSSKTEPRCLARASFPADG